jgi:ferric-dicitrate binding protein FerR (iron transport regulator)
MTEPRLGPPPVEKLSDVAWARVERGVFARMEGTITSAAASRDVRSERAGSRWVWLAVPAAAAAAFALAFFSLGRPTPTSPAGEPSRVVASAAPSSVSFADAHVTVEANSAIVMDPKAGKPTALVEHGTATFAVPPRGDRPPLVVLAADAYVRVSGATFRVSRQGERAELSVDHGAVEVRFRGHEVHVPAGSRWTSERPGEAIAPIDLELIELSPPTP